MNQDKSVDVVIVTALKKEHDAVLRYLNLPQRIESKNGVVYQSYLQHENSNSSYKVLLICLGRMGNVEAGIAAVQAIYEWNPTAIILTGIMGGVKSSERSLGDLGVAEQIVGYELGKVKDTGTEPRWKVLSPTRHLIEKARHFSPEKWAFRSIIPRPNGSSGRVPRVHFGLVASGEKVIADTNTIRELQRSWSKLIGVDMESFGVASAVDRLDSAPGMFMVKGISDWADSNKNDEWQEYAADVAAAYVINFLRSNPIGYGATPAIFTGVEDGDLFKTSPETIQPDNNTSEEARNLAVSNMQVLAKESSLSDVEACMILDAAIDNLNESDGWNGKLNTPMDKAFDAVMKSRFGKLCRDRLLQGYIQARDFRRNIIGPVFASRAITDSRILNADNATQILEPLLQKLFMGRSIEERVDAALQLMEAFFRSQSNSSNTRIDFLPHKLLRRTVKVLLSSVEDETASNDAVSTAAIWALLWLTNAKASDTYTVYKFTEGELDSLRRIAINKKGDALARSYSALILSICSSETTVFAQADWIYEWAVVADGGKPQRQLPVMTPLNRPKDVNIFKDLISLDLPIKAKGQVALALGRLGCFMSEMLEPLLQIFQNERSAWNQRDEALVYLVLTGGHKVISVLTQGASSPFENDHKKYDFPMRCFLALVGMGDVDALEYLLDLGGEESVVDSYAYALAGVADPRGREILEFMKNHKKNRVRSAVAKALEPSKNTDSGSVASGFENFFVRNLWSKLNQWNF